MNKLRSARSRSLNDIQDPVNETGWLLPSVTKRHRASDINTVRPEMLS